MSNLKIKEVKEGILVVLFAVVMIALIPSQVPEATRTWGVIRAVPGGHRLFPLISLGMALIGSLVLIYDGYKKKVAEAKKEKDKDLDNVGFWVTILVWGLYAVMVTYIGYIVSTALVSVFLLWYYGVDKWTKILAVAGGTMAFVYIIFVKLMMIPFPHSALFF